MSDEMNIKLERVTGDNAPRPVAAISIPDPAYGGAKLTTVLFPVNKDTFLVDEFAADAIFRDATLKNAFRVASDSKALPRRLYNDEKFMAEWEKAHEKKAEKKADDKSEK